MERIVFFGKGGIGKSTTSTNISAAFAAMGQRVLHVGCDPKHDSTVSLLGGVLLEPVVDKIHSLQGVTPEDIVVRSPLGIDCVEAGGPEAGVGCGGRGITRMMEIFNAAKLLSSNRYDTAVYDVLGDVVCGGFAAPLRKDIGEKVIIVASEEVMALYAANNIAKAVCHYSANGISLGGIIVNLRDNNEDRGPVERFAKVINTQILGYVPRDALIREAEYQRKTVFEYAPHAPISKVFRGLAEKVMALDAKALPLPTPLSEVQFYQYTRYRFETPPATAAAEEAARLKLQAESMSREGLLSAGKLLGKSDEARRVADQEAAKRAQELSLELAAGRRAVRLGRVSVDVALARLHSSFPQEAASLVGADLIS